MAEPNCFAQTTGLLQCLQLLAGFEANGFPGRDSHLGACAWISPNSGLAGPNIEDAEATQFNPITLRERPLHCFEDSFDSHLRFRLGDTGAVDHLVDDVEFNQAAS